MGGGIARYVSDGTEVDRVEAAETTFAKSNLPLALTDDFCKMVGKNVSDSYIAKMFSAGRITTPQIIKPKGALAPDSNQVSFLLL